MEIEEVEEETNTLLNNVTVSVINMYLYFNAQPS